MHVLMFDLQVQDLLSDRAAEGEGLVKQLQLQGSNSDPRSTQGQQSHGSRTSAAAHGGSGIDLVAGAKQPQQQPAGSFKAGHMHDSPRGSFNHTPRNVVELGCADSRGVHLPDVSPKRDVGCGCHGADH